MMVFAFYLLKMLLCSGILYGYYLFALKNHRFHQWNRFYLLFSVMLSLLLPFLKFTVFEPEQESQAVYFIQSVQSAELYIQGITVAGDTEMSPEQWLLFGYALISVLLFVFFLVALFRIVRLIRSHAVQHLHNVKFVRTVEPGTPFSFLRYIFWNDEIPLQSESGKQIFQHELVHVEEKHTLDKLFLQIVLTAFWCNPFFWLIRRELRFIHEFIADQKAVGEQGLAAFSAMVLQAAYPKHYNQLVNPFFQTSIKRRLMMLKKTNNPRLAYASRVIALPLIAATVFAFTVRTKPMQKENVSNEIASPSSVSPTIHSQLPVATDTIPKEKKQIATIDVHKKGEKKISELTITYTDGSAETLTEQEAAKRGLINNSYSNFKQANPSSSQDVGISVRGSIKPVYYLDGTEISEDELKAYDPKQIQSINVWKGEKALEKFGEKGKNGVVEIKTKSGSADASLTLLQNDKPLMNGKISSVTVDGEKVLRLNNNVVTNGDTLPKQAPLFQKVEIEASVNANDWRRFLESQLTPIIKEVGKRAAPGTYTVNVRFIVNLDGTLSDFKALNDPGYDLAEKVVGIMNGSPRWSPAEQNGRKVRSYHTQPITIVIAGNKKPTSTTALPSYQPGEIAKLNLHQLVGVPATDEIVSCQFKVGSGDGVQVVNNRGNSLNEETKKLLSLANKGSVVLVEKIVVYKNGAEIKLPAKAYAM